MENFQVIIVKYVSRTETRPSRISLYSPLNNSRKILSWSISTKTSKSEIAADYLTEKGFDIIGRAEGTDCEYIFTRTFLPIP